MEKNMDCEMQFREGTFGYIVQPGRFLARGGPAGRFILARSGTIHAGEEVW